MLIIGLLFFIFGFVTWLNGPLITFVKLAFQVEDVYAFLVPFAFYMSYLCSALPASLILRRTGMKKGMALGLFVMAIGAVLFGQFVSLRVFAGALTGLFVIGAGPVAAADRLQSVHQHPRPDRQRRAAHRLHGHLQQGRRRAGAVRVRRAGAERHRQLRASR